MSLSDDPAILYPSAQVAVVVLPTVAFPSGERVPLGTDDSTHTKDSKDSYACTFDFQSHIVFTYAVINVPVSNYINEFELRDLCYSRMTNYKWNCFMSDT